MRERPTKISHQFVQSFDILQALRFPREVRLDPSGFVGVVRLANRLAELLKLGIYSVDGVLIHSIVPL